MHTVTIQIAVSARLSQELKSDQQREGSGYSHYPKDSQLYECNKRQTLMSNVFYTPDKGFKGSDNFEVEIFAAGNSRTVRFRVTVK